MKKIFTSDNNALVGLVRSYVEEHNIPCQLRNEYASSVFGEVPFFSVWPELWVADLYEAQAIALVKEIQTPVNTGSDWTCGSCKEANPGSFELCWQCGQSI